MEFHNRAKKNLLRFIDAINSKYSFSEISNYTLKLQEHADFNSYFKNVVKIIKPLGPETDRETKSQYSCIRSNLAIVAGLYYGDNLSLKHIERDYKPDLSQEELKQEVIKFTSHILFGSEVSGVERVGDLQIEQEGLVPMMNRIMTEVEGDLEQKNELMKHFRVYQILSEDSLKASAEVAKDDPHLTLLRNTLANRAVVKSSFSTLSAEDLNSEKDNSKESESRGASFVEKYASNKKTSESKKTVGFSPNP